MSRRFKRQLARVAQLRARLRDDVNPPEKIRRPRGLSTREWQRSVRLLQETEAKLEQTARAYFGQFKKESDK